MSLKPLITIMAFAALLGVPPRALAQTPTSPVAQPSEPSLPPPRHVRRRIEIAPRPLLYRRCADWYELQHRPSGTVLYPQMRCWWVRG
ncbi:MAG TPA: hypothetical protein VN769_06145 [Xanthobacteraceae bacterium]|nr:hypothetical protein [Xanthobacteraceae bacterium]